MTWDGVLYHIVKGDYATAYAIGELVPLTFGTGVNINMQIAAFNADDKADGSGKAHISFISKELLAVYRMNPSRTPSSAPYNEGTGAIGGWEKSEMRTYLRGAIKSFLPSTVKSAIVEVTKVHTAYDTVASPFTQATRDDVWIPAWTEIATSSSLYGSLFPNNASRIKYNAGASNASDWWTRMATASSSFYRVSTSGSASGSNASNFGGIALGFCL